VRSGTIDLDAVVRVASPAFPKDKLESEVGIRGSYLLAQL
jgi:hypothetical protein